VSPGQRDGALGTITPRIFANDVAATVGFLTSVFDASADLEIDRPTEVRIGDGAVLVSDARSREHFCAFLYVYVADADDTFGRAMRAGAESLEDPTDTPYGDRRAMFRDAEGNVFQVAHRRAPSGA
jgi:uncharacterized glyoxalase superfamily protein PhnB